MSADPDDVVRIRGRLRGVEREAKGQAWAKERPWRRESHVWWEQGVPVVDLHDLGAALARQAVREVLEVPAGAGAVVFVHGRGRHSVGPQVLAGVVAKELDRACAETRGWRYRRIGAARTVWVSDPRRAPDWATGRWGPLVWAGWLGLGGCVVAAVGHALGWW
ncbi:MAG: hypothetical protein R3F59_24060 [Myxococcota bacterium]